MIVEAQVTIKGSKAAVWTAITDIENASETISGIKNIEVLMIPSLKVSLKDLSSTPLGGFHNKK